MATTTTNLGLSKPDYTDDADIDVINDNMDIIDSAFGDISLSTLRDVPFTILTTDWTLSNGVYSAEFTTAYVTASSKEWIIFDSTIRSAARRDIDVEKKSGGGGMVFTTSVVPTGSVTGTIRIFDNDDHKVPVIIENTVVPIANGGTNANTVADARTNLGLGDAAVTNVANNLTTTASGSVLDARQGKVLSDQIVPELIASSTASENSYTFMKCGNVFIFQIDGVLGNDNPYTITNADYLPTGTARGIVCSADGSNVKRIYCNPLDGKIKIASMSQNVGYYGEMVWVKY